VIRTHCIGPHPEVMRGKGQRIRLGVVSDSTPKVSRIL
jgi:hypothetical protein